MSQAKCYLRVVNWEAFQHYGDRMPPWIKLHNTVLEDPVIASLPDHSKAHVFGLWLLASRLKNKIPNNSKFIGARINATRQVDVNSLIDCKFLEHHPECLHDASNALAECSTDKNKRDKSREEEEEREKERAHPPSSSPPSVRYETTLFDAKRRLDQKLMGLVAQIADRLSRDSGTIMQEVTAYQKEGGQIVKGRVNPADLTLERVEKSIEDAAGWLADLDKQATA